MSELNNSLLGFLKKKSLFAESPIKGTHLKDRSKDKKSITSPSNHNLNKSYNQNSQSSKNLHM